MSNWMLYVVTVAVWGSTWIAIEFQLGDAAPEVSIFYRYLLASALLFGWCLLRGLKLRFTHGEHWRFLQLGITLFCINYILTYHSQAYITSALTAIAFSTMLWLNIVNSRLFFGTPIDRRVVAGSTLGIAGIVVLFMPEVDSLSLGDTTIYGISLALVGAFVASLGNMASKSAQEASLPIVQSNAWGMLYGTLLTGLIAFAGGHDFTPPTDTAWWISMLYLALFGSIVGFGTYLTLLGRIGPGRAGYAMVMFPVVAIVISVLVGETVPRISTAAGAALVILGNIIVLRAKPGRKRRRAARRGSGFAAHAVPQEPLAEVRVSGQGIVRCADGGPI